MVNISAVNRVIRIRPAQETPDLAPSIMAAAHPPRVGRNQWTRYALAAVAGTELALAIPGLLLGHGAESIHDGRHIGSFGAAIAVGLLYVAWRPIRAYGILPIATALAATMMITALIDIANGRATSLGEAHHMFEVTGLILVWMLAGLPIPPFVRHLAPAHRPRHLRQV